MPTIEMIKVQWRNNNRKPGSVCGNVIRGSDEKNRDKIVFVDNMFRGRIPKAGEVTEAEVVRDINPHDLTHGSLIVNPIYAAEAHALSEDDAKTEMIKIIKSQPVSFCETEYVKVSLSGWTGELAGQIVSREDGPIGRRWRYTDAITGRVLRIYNDGAPNLAFPITTAIARERHRIIVIDWERAIAELGQPEFIEAPVGRYRNARWRDKSGFRLEAAHRI